METPNPKTGFFQSNTARLIMVGMLTLVLFIPLALVQNLISERSYRQEEVKNKITSKWGGPVSFYGPIVKIPYKAIEETVNYNENTKQSIRQRRWVTQYAYFFPETLKNRSAVTTEKRHYGYFEAAVFTSKMNFDGHFVRPDFSSRDIADSDIMWDKAQLVIKTTNLKSIQDEVKIRLGQTDLAFEPLFNSSDYDTLDALETGFFDARVLRDSGNIPFKFDISYRGSDHLYFIPIGKTTTAAMTSNWESPSFTGNFLPNEKGATGGFPASWKILHVNRPFAQQSFEKLPNLSQFAFGVDFSIPVDQYLQNDRASKYGFLIIGLTFLIFFLIQMMSKVRIHIFQYGMIGLALIMFYTLLLSITEHSSFTFAYLIATAAVVIMISTYSISILKNRKFPLFIAGSLTALYGFIYVIIQMEDYALLFGSIGLFMILAAVMYFSRKIDWSN
jgi:inner membrane protein